MKKTTELVKLPSYENNSIQEKLSESIKEIRKKDESLFISLITELQQTFKNETGAIAGEMLNLMRDKIADSETTLTLETYLQLVNTIAENIKNSHYGNSFITEQRQTFVSRLVGVKSGLALFGAKFVVAIAGIQAYLESMKNKGILDDSAYEKLQKELFTEVIIKIIFGCGTDKGDLIENCDNFQTHILMGNLNEFFNSVKFVLSNENFGRTLSECVSSVQQNLSDIEGAGTSANSKKKNR